MTYRDEWRTRDYDPDWGPPTERDKPSKLVVRCATAAILLRVLVYPTFVIVKNQSGHGPVASALGALDLITALLAFVTFLFWVYRTNNNLRALGATRLKFKPGAAVAWFFFPLAWPFIPYYAIGELYRASEPHARLDEWRSESVPIWFHAWWISLVIHFLLYQRVRTEWSRPPAGSPGETTVVDVLSILFIVAAGILGALLLTRIEERIASRRRLAWSNRHPSGAGRSSW